MLNECQIQAQCTEWFRYHYPNCILFGVFNEATHERSTYFSSIGLLKGVSDLVVVLPKHIMFVEMKSKDGKQRPEQKIFQENIERLGFEYYIIRSLDQFKELIHEYTDSNDCKV